MNFRLKAFIKSDADIYTFKDFFNNNTGFMSFDSFIGAQVGFNFTQLNFSDSENA